MRISIHQPHCFPWLGYLDKIAKSDTFVLLDNTQFEKQEFQNRNSFLGPNGRFLLTVPVKKQKHTTLIRDQVIDRGKFWPAKNWRNFENAYARSNYWGQYKDELRAIFFGPHLRMTDFSDAVLAFLTKEFGIQTTLVKASSLKDVSGFKTNLVVSICQSTGATAYLSGTGAKSYLNEATFKSHNIALEYQQFTLPKYPKRFPDPAEDVPLSSIDYLLNMGPSAAQELLTIELERA